MLRKLQYERIVYERNTPRKRSIMNLRNIQLN